MPTIKIYFKRAPFYNTQACQPLAVDATTVCASLVHLLRTGLIHHRLRRFLEEPFKATRSAGHDRYWPCTLPSACTRTIFVPNATRNAGSAVMTGQIPSE